MNSKQPRSLLMTSPRTSNAAFGGMSTSDSISVLDVPSMMSVSLTLRGVVEPSV